MLAKRGFECGGIYDPTRETYGLEFTHWRLLQLAGYPIASERFGSRHISQAKNREDGILREKGDIFRKNKDV